MVLVSFWRQTKYLLYRNFHLKIRNKKQTGQEILFPVIFMLSLAIVSLSNQTTTSPAIPSSSLWTYPLYDEYRSFLPNASMPLGYAPNTSDMTLIMSTAAGHLNITADPKVIGYATEEDLVEAYRNSEFETGIVFEVGFDLFQNMTYKIRLPLGRGPSPTMLYAGQDVCRSFNPGMRIAAGNCPANQYLYSGFSAVQVAMDHSIASFINDSFTAPLPSISFKMFPKGEYASSTDILSIMGAIYYVIMFTPYIAVLLSNIVGEKEKKIKECMKIMGLREAAFWVAWIITYSFMVTVAALIIAALSYAILIFSKSNFFIIFLILLFYGLSLVTLSFMLTPFFDRALSAGAFGGTVNLGLSLVFLPLTLIEGVPPAVQWVLSIFSPIAMALSMDTAIKYETTQGGLTFDTIAIGDFPPYAGLLMLVIDTFLYLLLAIYFENVIPSAYGQRKPFYFFLLPSYWNPKSFELSDTTHLLSDVNRGADNENTNINPDDIEVVSDELKGRNGIRIQGLAKIFPGNKRKGKPDVRAVDGVSLDIYEGQITCLLGHNGAGKTTLISALSGLLPATSGSATVYGRDVRDPIAMDDLRTMMGICPQQNTLFEYLSPYEHLKVYAGLQGIPEDRMEERIQEMLKLVGLEKQSATFSKDLSGGQQRKLCVAMAIIGDPKVLFLDEPSSGMDPYSRRNLWSLLKKQREGRVTLLTTHFMDEADILADRKAIMSKGKLRCYGSSLFLKSRFGIGYHLGMVVDQNTDIEPITTLVQNHVPDSAVGRAHGMELSYTLPLKEVSTFAGLFEALDGKHESQDRSVGALMGIQSYGVSMTTLEEVFLKLGEEEEEEDEKDAKNPEPKDVQNGGSGIADGEHNSCLVIEEDNQPTTRVEMKESPLDTTILATKPIQATFKAQVVALIKVQLIQALRNPETYVTRLVFPIIYFVLSCVMVTLINIGGQGNTEPKSLTLDPQMYPWSILYQDSLPADQNISQLVSQFDTRLYIESDQISNVSGVEAVAPHSIALDVMNIESNAQYTALYNDSQVASLPLAINMMSNSLYGILLGLLGNDSLITTMYQPFPETNVVYAINNGFIFALFFGFGLVGVPAGYAVNVIKDRQIKARAQLRVSGVEGATYWMARCIVDCAQYGFIALVGIIVLVCFRIDSFIQPGAIFAMLLALIIYVPINVICAYCVSYMFDDYETAQGILPQPYFWLTAVLTAPVLVLDFIVSSEGAAAVHLILCAIYPPYMIFGAGYYIDRVYQYASFFGTVDQIKFGDYFKMENIILPTLLVSLIPIIWLVFLLRYLEIKSTGGDGRDTCPGAPARRPMATGKVNNDEIENEDSDVKAERHNVEQIFEQDAKCAVAINSLRCEFAKRGGDKDDLIKVAVRNLSLSVNKGEVMGLLGPNGAGKTTTLNTVIAENEPTKGQVRVAGYDITSALNEAFLAMGYCPQVDPLWEDLSMRQHLELYAAIKGIHKTDIKNVTEHYMESLGISEHADKRGKNLSGGTKRKLCFALSMLGDPRVVLLDEPSTGMDPKSKRFLWNTITSSFIDKRGAILTTHSMEEADAVCSRVGIMVTGQLQCLGTTQHLKDKYGGGYMLEIKLKMGALYHAASDTQQQGALNLLGGKVEALKKYVHEILADAEIIEEFGERISYSIPKTSVISIASVFSAMEKGKETLDIEEYSFSQSTLEQVFIQFAKMQDEEERKADDPQESGSNARAKSPLDRQMSLPRPQNDITSSQENPVEIQV